MGLSIDGMLVQWGDRLFYPGNRTVKPAAEPRLGGGLRQRAAGIRRRIESTVVRRAPQVMVKVTGGGRGMGAIAAHFRYISKNGRLAFEDDRGVVQQDKEALRDLEEQWRWGGSKIEETSHRREAFNIMLSMPRGTDPQAVLCAAREFAKIELQDHRYVMVLHDHQENPHVHLSVRAESMSGKRLNPRKADLHRWRETFAERLRGWGVEAEATRQASRCASRRFQSLWQIKAAADVRLKQAPPATKSGAAYQASRIGAMEAWARLFQALRASAEPGDKELAERIGEFMRESAFFKEVRSRAPSRQAPQSIPREMPRKPLAAEREPGREPQRTVGPGATRGRSGPDRSR